MFTHYRELGAWAPHIWVHAQQRLAGIVSEINVCQFRLSTKGGTTGDSYDVPRKVNGHSFPVFQHMTKYSYFLVLSCSE